MNPAETNSEIKKRLLKLMPSPGDYPSAIDGFGTYRRDEASRPEMCFFKPRIVVTVQGEKLSVIGSEKVVYGENRSMIAGIDIPVANYVTKASREKPFMSMALYFDTAIISKLMTELPEAEKTKTPNLFKGAIVADIDPHIMDAFLRLLELLDDKSQIPFLAPAIKYEIHYRLLSGPLGAHLWKIYTPNTQSARITKAISYLKENYKNPIQVEELASVACMSPTSFFRNFKTVTTLSPIQFQKKLRLCEAQRLMRWENETASSAAEIVGYESLSQFTREYKRMFGAPPRKSIMT